LQPIEINRWRRLILVVSAVAGLGCYCASSLLVQTPLCSQWLVASLRLAEVESACFLRHSCALLLGLQAGNQFCLKSAGLLGIEITDFLGNINQSINFFIVAFLCALSAHATSSANLDRKLFTGSVSNKFTRSFLNISGSTGGFINSSTFLLALSIANLLLWPVALSDGLFAGLLLERDLALLLKVLLANLFLCGPEVGDICVMALLQVLVGAGEDGVLGDGLYTLLLDHAESSILSSGGSREVDTTSNTS